MFQATTVMALPKAAAAVLPAVPSAPALFGMAPVTSAATNAVRTECSASFISGFAYRAVKMSGMCESQLESSTQSFLAAPEGDRLAVADGSCAVHAMRQYLADRCPQIDYNGSYSSLSCIGQPSAAQDQTATVVEATVKGDCSVAVCRPDGSISFSTSNCGSEPETNYITAKANDIVVLQSGRLSADSLKHLRRFARQDVDGDIEDLAEDLLEKANKAGMKKATVVVARVADMRRPQWQYQAEQPPVTL